MNTKSRICPVCGGRKTIKKGSSGNRKQLFGCKECGHRFTLSYQKKKTAVHRLWIDFVFHKQTLRELAETYPLDRKTIYAYLLSYVVREKKHHPRPVHLLVDALYFGVREERTSWCALVFRDHDTKENLWWTWGRTETESLYFMGRETLESLGYTILSVTGDGFIGVRTAFSGIPYQMCLVHMERIVVRGTTRNPKLVPGQVLLALIKTIFYTDGATFTLRVNEYIKKYQDFLNERATSPTTGEWWYVHEELRKAVLSLHRFLPYLFTYERDRSIPPTTNSLEGHFAHVRDVVTIHRGASKELKQKIMHTIFLASTIAPDEEDLDGII